MLRHHCHWSNISGGFIDTFYFWQFYLVYLVSPQSKFSPIFRRRNVSFTLFANGHVSGLNKWQNCGQQSLAFLWRIKVGTSLFTKFLRPLFTPTFFSFFSPKGYKIYIQTTPNNVNFLCTKNRTHIVITYLNI